MLHETRSVSGEFSRFVESHSLRLERRTAKIARGSLIALVVCLHFSLHPLAAQGLDTNSCYSIALTQPLGWPTSGVWTEEGNLLVIDVFRDEITGISVSGEISTAHVGPLISSRGLEPVPLDRPSQIRYADETLLVEDEQSDAIIPLNESFQASGQVLQIKATKLGASETLSVIYDWAPVGTGILAFGDVYDQAGNWKTDLLFLDGTGRHETFYSMPITAPERDFYLQNLAHIATIGDVGYVLLRKEEPSIAVVSTKAGSPPFTRLQAFPGEFRSNPAIQMESGWRGPQQATEFLKAMEKSTTAVGLYAWDRMLLLLAKESGNEAGTRWWLIQLDPNGDGTEVSRLLLPTKAAHLTVIPGSTFFALLEKPRVQPQGPKHAPVMFSSSMVLVPTHWIQNPYAAGLDENSHVACRQGPSNK